MSVLGQTHRFGDVRCTSANTPIADELAKLVEFSIEPNEDMQAAEINSGISAQKKGTSMKLHANAQTCPHCRSLIVSRVLAGQEAASVARDFRVSTKTVLKWIARFRAEGPGGLDD